MAETYGVFAGSPVTEDTVLARWYRQFAPSGVVRDGLDADQRLQVTADGTAEIRVRPGYCLAGGYWYRSTEDVTEQVSPNASAAARVDLVVVRADPLAGSSVDPGEAGIVIKQGVSGAGTAPSPTRDPDDIWEIPLAEITVAGNASVVNAGAVVDVRQYTGHGAVPMLADYPNADVGEGGLAMELSTGRLRYVYNGAYVTAHDPRYPTDWEALTLGSGYENFGSTGSAPSGRFWTPTRVELRGTIARSDGGVIPQGAIIARVPPEMRPADYARHIGAAYDDGDHVSVRLDVAPLDTAAFRPGQVRVLRANNHDPTWVALDGFEYEIE
ncbi:hypothetical protein [Streptomonospora litoralis]|uniref:Minor tail protein n=1 Tax=Streptomonospora litoralis TaxID=2498135 RepID=A0A4P6PYU7_9ACTN|nr:hypothetical protein [Streptomonospora litoralis]QBI53418.1 hypothetical protein EKD16_08120 [Streptomonospora litoralis]